MLKVEKLGSGLILLEGKSIASLQEMLWSLNSRIKSFSSVSKELLNKKFSFHH